MFLYPFDLKLKDLKPLFILIWVCDEQHQQHW